MSKRNIPKKGTIRLRIPLNAVAILIAFVGLAYPFAGQSPSHVVSDARSMLADAGASLSASVPANPYNTLSEQLRAKEQALSAREDALNAREAPVILTMGEIFGFSSFALSVILFGLIGANFYWDSRRSRKPMMLANKFSIDLR